MGTKLEKVRALNNHRNDFSWSLPDLLRSTVASITEGHHEIDLRSRQTSCHHFWRCLEERYKKYHGQKLTSTNGFVRKTTRQSDLERKWQCDQPKDGFDRFCQSVGCLEILMQRSDSSNFETKVFAMGQANCRSLLDREASDRFRSCVDLPSTTHHFDFAAVKQNDYGTKCDCTFHKVSNTPDLTCSKLVLSRWQQAINNKNNSKPNNSKFRPIQTDAVDHFLSTDTDKIEFNCSLEFVPIQIFV